MFKRLKDAWMVLIGKKTAIAKDPSVYFEDGLLAVARRAHDRSKFV